MRTLDLGSRGHQGFPSPEARALIATEMAVLGLAAYLMRDKSLPAAAAQGRPRSHGETAQAMLTAIAGRGTTKPK